MYLAFLVTAILNPRTMEGKFWIVVRIDSWVCHDFWCTFGIVFIMPYAN